MYFFAPRQNIICIEYLNTWEYFSSVTKCTMKTLTYFTSIFYFVLLKIQWKRIQVWKASKEDSAAYLEVGVVVIESSCKLTVAKLSLYLSSDTYFYSFLFDTSYAYIMYVF